MAVTSPSAPLRRRFSLAGAAALAGVCSLFAQHILRQGFAEHLGGCFCPPEPLSSSWGLASPGGAGSRVAEPRLWARRPHCCFWVMTGVRVTLWSTPRQACCGVPSGGGGCLREKGGCAERRLGRSGTAPQAPACCALLFSDLPRPLGARQGFLISPWSSWKCLLWFGQSCSLSAGSLAGPEPHRGCLAATPCCDGSAAQGLCPSAQCCSHQHALAHLSLPVLPYD